MITQKRYIRILSLFLFFILFGIIIHYTATNTHQILEYHGKKLILITYNKKSILIAGSTLQSAKINAQWVQYTLKPALIKTTGKAVIDNIIVCVQPTPQWITELQKQIPIRAIQYQAMPELPSYTAQLLADQMD